MKFLLNSQDPNEIIMYPFPSCCTTFDLFLSPTASLYSPSLFPLAPSLSNNCALESSERPALFLTMASFEKEITVIKNNKLRILEGLPLWEDNLQNQPFPDHNFSQMKEIN